MPKLIDAWRNAYVQFAKALSKYRRAQRNACELAKATSAERANLISGLDVAEGRYARASEEMHAVLDRLALRFQRSETAQRYYIVGAMLCASQLHRAANDNARRISKS